MIVRNLLMIHYLRLNHLCKCIFNVPVSCLWDIGLVYLSFINVISILMRHVLLRNVFIFLKSFLLRSVMISAYIILGSCSCVRFPKSFLLFLKIYVDLLIVLRHIFVRVCVRVRLICHFNYFYL